MRALIFELRPESLESEGLVAALDKQVAATRARYGIKVDVTACSEPGVPIGVKEALFRIGQEALHNTVKHARASQVQMSLAETDGRIVLQVEDDGQGFDPGGEFPGHLGLRSMKERMERLGGRFSVESSPGAGTRVRAEVPLRN
jgi:signal transduction histidine kinase